jgi:hypothetical protein
MIARVLKSRAFVAMVALLILQQLIVASSTLWLTRLAVAVQAGAPFVLWLALYLGALLLPYLPGGLALVQLRRWELEAHGHWLDAGAQALFGRIGLWTNKQERERRTSLYAKDALHTLSGFTEYAYNLAACVLNTVLNVVAICLIVEPLFLAGYLTSLVLAALLVKLQARTSNRLAGEAERARVALGGSLIKVWDNAVIGNHYNFGLWRGRVRNAFEDARARALRATSFGVLISIGIALITFAPTVGALALGLYRHAGDQVYLTSLVVTLPRLFQILSSSQVVLSTLSEWSAQRGRLDVVEELFIPGADARLEDRIHREDIEVRTSGGVAPLPALGELAGALGRPGRITLRGKNGSGKSTLLLLLKAQLGERALYLPPHGELVFADDAGPASTGQAMSRSLEELVREGRGEVLLLDEWDANLDGHNRRRLSAVIDQLAASRCVVEVRHGVET